jgi:hypothetical protein
MLVRADGHDGSPATVRYRDFWGQNKREQLAAATADPAAGPEYEALTPDQANWFRLLRWHPRQGYENWPAVIELCAEDPMLGLNENRQFALIDSDRTVLAARIRAYLDPNVPMAQVDPRLSRKFSGFDPAKVRSRLLAQHPFDEHLIRPFQFRPLDMRHAYIETDTQLWNRARPLLVAAEKAASGFLLARRRAPRALDGAALHYSDCLVDQKVLFTDAYAIPFWLSAASGKDDQSGTLSLLDLDTDQPDSAWRPNLSSKALDYLRQLGVHDADASKDTATLIWLHALAIGLSRLYVEQNGEAVRSDWPRIPLPASAEALRESAALGAQAAALLNPHVPVAGVDAAPVDARLRAAAVIERADGKQLNPGTGDLAVTAAWGIVQPRAVMPGSGKYDIRERAAADNGGLSDQDRDLLGEQVLDIYLNDQARWRGVPGAAWDYKIGGFQVLRKWLSYRDRRVLGRDLTADEAHAFTAIVRRLAALVLLGPQLDANYLKAADAA